MKSCKDCEHWDDPEGCGFGRCKVVTPIWVECAEMTADSWGNVMCDDDNVDDCKCYKEKK